MDWEISKDAIECMDHNFVIAHLPYITIDKEEEESYQDVVWDQYSR